MTAIPFPEPPVVGGIQLGTGQTRLRFEDVAQDGRLRLEGIWPAIGPILWGKMAVAETLARLGERGVRAVLSYVQLEGGSDPISVRAKCEQEVRWRISQTVDQHGKVTRLLFDTWLITSAPRGQASHPGGAPVSSESVRVARAYGQHVFTRPTAPPGQHRVLELDDPLLEGLERERTGFKDPSALFVPPSGAEPLDPSPRADALPTVFGLCHSDGNQHVNFLSYPRLAEEAALRRFAELGLGARRLSRRAEVGYRKPCFAGEAVRLVTQVFRSAGELEVIAAFFGEDAGASAGSDWSSFGRPRCVARLGFPDPEPGT